MMRNPKLDTCSAPHDAKIINAINVLTSAVVAAGKRAAPPGTAIALLSAISLVGCAAGAVARGPVIASTPPAPNCRAATTDTAKEHSNKADLDAYIIPSVLSKVGHIQTVNIAYVDPNSTYLFPIARTDFFSKYFPSKKIVIRIRGPVDEAKLLDILDRDVRRDLAVEISTVEAFRAHTDIRFSMRLDGANRGVVYMTFADGGPGDSACQYAGLLGGHPILVSYRLRRELLLWALSRSGK